MDFEIGAAIISEDESRSCALSSAVNWANRVAGANGQGVRGSPKRRKNETVIGCLHMVVYRNCCWKSMRMLEGWETDEQLDRWSCRRLWGNEVLMDGLGVDNG